MEPRTLTKRGARLFGRTTGLLALLALASAALIAACGGDDEVAQVTGLDERGHHNTSRLVTTEWIEDNLDIDSVLLIDLRGADDYAAGHIAGAGANPTHGVPGRDRRRTRPDPTRRGRGRRVRRHRSDARHDDRVLRLARLDLGLARPLGARCLRARGRPAARRRLPALGVRGPRDQHRHADRLGRRLLLRLRTEREPGRRLGRDHRLDRRSERAGLRRALARGILWARRARRAGWPHS